MRLQEEKCNASVLQALANMSAATAPEEDELDLTPENGDDDSEEVTESLEKATIKEEPEGNMMLLNTSFYDIDGFCPFQIVFIVYLC